MKGLLCQRSKYDKEDQQGKATFNERNTDITQQQEPMTREPRRTPNKNWTEQRQGLIDLICQNYFRLKTICLILHFNRSCIFGTLGLKSSPQEPKISRLK
jgi:hypothetical protein